MPGSDWNGLGNQPTAIGAGGQPVQPVKPPAKSSGARGFVVVNTKPLAVSTHGTGDSFVFRRDSAGFGVPRGSLGKLDGFSRDAVHHGSASIPVFSPGFGMGQNSARVAQAGVVQSPRVGMAPSSTWGAANGSMGSSMERPATGGTPTGYGHPSMGASGAPAGAAPSTGGISMGSRGGGGASPK